MNLIFFKGIYSFCIPLYIYLIIYLFILIYIIKCIQFYICDMLNTFLLDWFQFLKFLFPPIRSVFKYWITTSVGLVLPRGGQLKSHLAVHHCAIHTLYKEVDGLKIEADKWNIDFRQRFVEVGNQLIDFKFADQLTFLQMW